MKLLKLYSANELHNTKNTTTIQLTRPYLEEHYQHTITKTVLPQLKKTIQNFIRAFGATLIDYTFDLSNYAYDYAMHHVKAVDNSSVSHSYSKILHETVRMAEYDPWTLIFNTNDIDIINANIQIIIDNVFMVANTILIDTNNPDKRHIRYIKHAVKQVFDQYPSHQDFDKDTLEDFMMYGLTNILREFKAYFEKELTTGTDIFTINAAFDEVFDKNGTCYQIKKFPLIVRKGDLPF